MHGESTCSPPEVAPFLDERWSGWLRWESPPLIQSLPQPSDLVQRFMRHLCSAAAVALLASALLLVSFSPPFSCEPALAAKTGGRISGKSSSHSSRSHSSSSSRPRSSSGGGNFSASKPSSKPSSKSASKPSPTYRKPVSPSKQWGSAGSFLSSPRKPSPAPENSAPRASPIRPNIGITIIPEAPRVYIPPPPTFYSPISPPFLPFTTAPPTVVIPSSPLLIPQPPPPPPHSFPSHPPAEPYPAESYPRESYPRESYPRESQAKSFDWTPLLVGGATVGGLAYAARKMREGRGEASQAGIGPISIVKVQVAFPGWLRAVGAALTDLANRADVSSQRGLQRMLSDACLVVLRNRHDVMLASTEVVPAASEAEFDRLFTAMSLSERSKIPEETVSNLSRSWPMRKFLEMRDPGSQRPQPTFVVVTILAALSLPPDQLSAVKGRRVGDSLEAIGSVAPSSVLAAEVLWLPEADDDTLTEEELLRDFPNLLPV